MQRYNRNAVTYPQLRHVDGLQITLNYHTQKCEHTPLLDASTQAFHKFEEMIVAVAMHYVNSRERQTACMRYTAQTGRLPLALPAGNAACPNRPVHFRLFRRYSNRRPNDDCGALPASWMTSRVRPPYQPSARNCRSSALLAKSTTAAHIPPPSAEPSANPGAIQFEIAEPAPGSGHSIFMAISASPRRRSSPLKPSSSGLVG